MGARFRGGLAVLGCQLDWSFPDEKIKCFYDNVITPFPKTGPVSLLDYQQISLSLTLSITHPAASNALVQKVLCFWDWECVNTLILMA